MLWALAVLGHEPRSLLAAVAERALETSGKFQAPDIVNMLWAYASLLRRRRIRRGIIVAEEDPAANADVVRALCAQALANPADFTPYQCEPRVEPGDARRADPRRGEPRVGRDFGSRGFRSRVPRPPALTHALWAVGVMGTASDGNSGAFKTLLAEAASRAKRRAIGARAPRAWCGRAGGSA